MRVLDSVVASWNQQVDESAEQLQATGRASASAPAAPGTAPASVVADVRPSEATTDLGQELPEAPDEVVPEAPTG